MTSFPETSNFEEYSSVSERNLGYKPSEMKKNSVPFIDTSSEKGLNSETKEINSVPAENNQKRKISLESCGIHRKNTAEKTELQTADNRNHKTLVDEKNTHTLLFTANAENNLNNKSDDVSQSLQLRSFCDNPHDTNLCSENENTDKSKYKEQTDEEDNTDLSMKNELRKNPENDLNLKPKNKYQIDISPDEETSQNLLIGTAITSKSKMEDLSEIHCQSSLPDILSTLNKPLVSSRVKNVDEISNNLTESVDLDKGKGLTSKSFLSQTSYLLSSEALHNEMEVELSQLRNLHSLRTNESIYKLAYDENVSDHSEDSRSPSPMDPESHVPSSLTNAEILIHEADSGSEAGSEDVELLPHRYESETFLNESKHVYVNRLSLAVELLRTQENLPYDDEFKRVVGENNFARNIVPVHTGGKVNLGFREESYSPNTFKPTNSFENKSTITTTSSNEIPMQCHMKLSANSSNDSAIFSDIDFGSLDDDELCETAKEVAAQDTENQDNTEGIRLGYRRFGVQARHYFSPRGALSFNPCFCCIIM